MVVLLDFCRAVLNWKDGESRQPHLGNLVATLEKVVESGKRVSLRLLRKIASEFRVEQTSWSLRCSLNPVDKSIQVEIRDQKNQTNSTFCEKGLVDSSHDQTTAEELFFLLSSRGQRQLRIASESLGFEDEGKQSVTVWLSNKVSPDQD